MSDLADLYPGFASHWIATDAGKIFVRTAGEGAPVLLLHGFPETMAMWHRVAPALSRTHSVVLMDLRGYGWSAAPRPDERHEVYSKRAMGTDAVRVMEHLGHARFALVGHDRGARVAYRLALDHPGRLSKLALLDILPTVTMWEGMEAGTMTGSPHWPWLAQPTPIPETEILKDSAGWLARTMASWTASKDLSAFDGRAFAHYRAFFDDPSRVRAVCEDYRAGATVDREADEADRAAGRTIQCPTLILWGTAGIPASGAKPLEAWRGFAPDATGRAIEGGHFLAEENPDATLAALQAFL